jgi:predicted phage terminase large subunit-like protein
LRLIDDKLIDVASGKIKRLIISLPPRSGKSWLVSEFFPPWCLGIYPDKKIRLVSHDKTSATNWCRHSLRHFRETKELFNIYHNVPLEIGKETESYWELENRNGLMESIGIGGQLLSKGADILIIDDPATPEEADSFSQSDKLWDWFRKTAYPRLEPDGVILVIAQRLNENDLIGHILKELTHDSWEYIRMPAFAEQNDILGRAEGEPLWEDRWSKDKLENIRQTVGSHIWCSQYQQNPLSAESAIFKPADWVFFETPPEKYEMKIQAWDTAYKDKKASAFSSCITLGLHGNNIDVIDVFHDKPSFFKLYEISQRLAFQYKVARVLVEDASSGISLIQSLKEATTLPVTAIPTMNKVERAHLASAYVERHQIRLFAGATWLPTFINELTAFPNSNFKDIVDSFCIGVLYLVKFMNKTNGKAHDIKIRPQKIKDVISGF